MVTFVSHRSSVAATIVGALLLASLLSRRIFYTHATPEGVRQAIVDAGVLGKTPAEAVERLRSIRLPGVGAMSVGRYLPDQKLIEVSVPAAGRMWYSTWSVNASVTFDATGHATGLEVHSSVDNPL